MRRSTPPTTAGSLLAACMLAACGPEAAPPNTASGPVAPASTQPSPPAATTMAMIPPSPPASGSASLVLERPPAPPAASSAVAAPLPAAPGACGFIEATVGAERVRLEARQRFERVDPRTGVEPVVHLGADNVDRNAKLLALYVGGDGALEKNTRFTLTVPAKKVTGPNMGLDEIEGRNVKATVTRLGRPGERAVGTFRATVTLDGKTVLLEGRFDVCRLPDRNGP